VFVGVCGGGWWVSVCGGGVCGWVCVWGGEGGVFVGGGHTFSRHDLTFLFHSTPEIIIHHALTCID